MDRAAQLGHEIDQSPAAATDGKRRTRERYRCQVGDLLVLKENNLHDKFRVCGGRSRLGLTIS